VLARAAGRPDHLLAFKSSAWVTGKPASHGLRVPHPAPAAARAAADARPAPARAASASMVLLNKATLSSFAFTSPISLLLFQCLVCVVLVRGCSVAGAVKLEPWSFAIARLWFPVNVIFVGMIWTSFFALKHLGVPMATVLKNMTNLFTICGDYLLYGKTYGAGVWLTLALMTVSAVCGAATDLAFSFEVPPAPRSPRAAPSPVPSPHTNPYCPSSARAAAPACPAPRQAGAAARSPSLPARSVPGPSAPLCTLMVAPGRPRRGPRPDSPRRAGHAAAAPWPGRWLLLPPARALALPHTHARATIPARTRRRRLLRARRAGGGAAARTRARADARRARRRARSGRGRRRGAPARGARGRERRPVS